MKILMLTQVLPYPPDSGPKVKTWNVIQYLARSHDITLVSFVRGDQSESVRAIQRVCKAVYTVPIRRTPLLDAWYMLSSLITRQSFIMKRDDRAEMGDLVDRLASRFTFHVVHADQLNMAQYAMRVSGTRKILDAHNAVWLLYKRLSQTMPSGPKKWLLDRDWSLIKEYEGRVCREFDAIFAVSEEDRLALEEAAGQALNATVVPISVDTDQTGPVNRCPDADHILHMGTMYWPPNIDGILWFLQEVLPLIREQKPAVVFDVVGANPPREIIAFGKTDQQVNVTGYIADPSPYLEQAALTVVPLRAGGGMRVKILNALAQGLPVVSTTLGCEGIAVEKDRHLLIADSPVEFARAVLCLLNDRALSDRLGRTGRELILSKYDVRKTGKLIELAYVGG